MSQYTQPVSTTRKFTLWSPLQSPRGNRVFKKIFCKPKETRQIATCLWVVSQHAQVTHWQMTFWDILWITASRLIIYSLRGWKTNYDIPSGFNFEWCSYQPSTIFQVFKAILVKTKMKRNLGIGKAVANILTKASLVLLGLLGTQ